MSPQADQRREISLNDHEQIALFRSILSCAVAEEQRSGGRNQDSCRKAIDTLTLGVITSWYMSLGQRGINLDKLQWGYLDMDRFNSFAVWEDTKPHFLTVKSPCKGDKVNGTMHLADILHHRDPIRCPIAMLGMYFAYQVRRLAPILPPMRAHSLTPHASAVPDESRHAADAQHLAGGHLLH